MSVAGEDRYHCFNHTIYQESMLRDGRINESSKNDVSLDEFDPANDIEDYPADDKVINKCKNSMRDILYEINNHYYNYYFMIFIHCEYIWFEL